MSLGERIDRTLVAQVAALDARIAALAAQGALPGLVETVPTFRSLTLIYDPLLTTRRELQQALAPALATAIDGTLASGRSWRLPVCYGGDFGPDLAATAAAAGLDEAAVIALHHGRDYRVYMLGFLPGFPFIGDVAEPLRLPRRSEPRPRVAPGSVAVAGGLTAVYPSASPGGWHLLGRCPVPLFDLASAQPSLLQPGDRVRFTPVEAAEYARLERALAGGELPRERFAAAGDPA
ncbi:MAG TPA: 5-oxoprolinase subunit PxpB [Gammaproteobacteria bacterium]